MADEHSLVTTVECQHCKVRHKIYVAAQTGVAQMREQVIPCINCGKYFALVVPDKIVDGPFAT
jgi:DNA-directed RNA polymerase subunit M/transcription elongation factor TFIIS